VIAVVPARGGSKGVRRKNLRPVDGEPLVLRAARIAKVVTDRVVVTSDDPEILGLAEAWGYETWLRPAELASDEATIDQVATWVAGCGEPFLMLQPTVLVDEPTLDGFVKA